MTRTAVVMQPTFLPWLGYFALIDEADDFVFLDDVQFSRQSWQSRNRVSGPNGEVLLSLPIARKPSKPLIRETRIADSASAAPLLARIEGCLGTAPHWSVVAGLLGDALDSGEGNLADLNIALIGRISDLLGLRTRFHRASDLDLPAAGRGTRLVAICQALGAERYLSPVGALSYLAEDNAFLGSPVELVFQNFRHPVYRQRREPFLSHMSAIDMIAYAGADRTAAAIRDGIGPALSIVELEARQDPAP